MQVCFLSRFIFSQVYTGFWLGLLSSLTAWLLTLVVAWLVNDAVENLAELYDSQYHLASLAFDESILLLMLGSMLG